MEEERRKTSRIKKNLIVQYASDEKINLKWGISLIKDISDMGMSITTGKSFAPEENLLIRLKLPSQPYRWIDLKGAVIESKSYGGENWLTRVRFLKLNNEDKELIKDYIAWFLIKERGAK
ncbi:MAG: PilZ domain-containing protein [Candidatus Omnitrophica bacterium]|nr:PilZ domain-containing protein [Candidatus Omnitrophota bacterium]